MYYIAKINIHEKSPLVQSALAIRGSEKSLEKLKKKISKARRSNNPNAVSELNAELNRKKKTLELSRKGARRVLDEMVYTPYERKYPDGSKAPIGKGALQKEIFVSKERNKAGFYTVAIVMNIVLDPEIDRHSQIAVPSEDSSGMTAPITYICTKPDFNPFVDVWNDSVWTLKSSSNVSKIRAVMFDQRQTPSGDIFIAMPDTTLYYPIRITVFHDEDAEIEEKDDADIADNAAKKVGLTFKKDSDTELSHIEWRFPGSRCKPFPVLYLPDDPSPSIRIISAADAFDINAAKLFAFMQAARRTNCFVRGGVMYANNLVEISAAITRIGRKLNEAADMIAQEAGVERDEDLSDVDMFVDEWFELAFPTLEYPEELPEDVTFADIVNSADEADDIDSMFNDKDGLPASVIIASCITRANKWLEENPEDEEGGLSDE